MLAEKSIESNPVSIEFLHGNTPAVSSLEIARRFGKNHKHVMRDIQGIVHILPKSFVESNFGLMSRRVDAGNGASRSVPVYLLTRDAFSLLVMGFTGSAAIRWKLAYIEAFNTLEAAALENRAALARDLGYQQGLSDARALPAVEQKRQDALVVVERAVGYLCKGLTMTDAAALTGCPASTLRGRLNRVRKLVAELPQKYAGGVTA